VELAKKFIGWTRSTGDDFVLPLAAGMMIGRIGCFLTGLDDHTYGVATTWVTGVDFGDGIKRHPTQLYEIFFLGILLFILFQFKRKKVGWEGLLFQLFMLGYLVFRLIIDFIKPTPHPYWILNNIQIASILGIMYYIRLISKKQLEKRGELHA
jgi:prolipoprotein diacylglyceryltransferase